MSLRNNEANAASIAALGPLTEDLFLGGRVRARQPAAGFRAGLDSVTLAAAIAARPGDRVLDAGCGAGVAALCLMSRLPGTNMTALEVEPGLAALARDNARLNGMLLEVIEGDVLVAPGAGRREAFDEVMTNPPFLEPGRGTAPPLPLKARAHVGRRGDAASALVAWLDACRAHLEDGGYLTLIHRADRLPEILAAMTPGFGDVRLLPLWPHAGEAARRVIVRGRKGARSPARLLAGLVLHAPGGGPTDEAEAILRGGGALALE